MPNPAPRAPRMSFDARHRFLLDVAADLIETEGPDGLRMDALARTAGVTRPVVYEHFANRDALLAELIVEHGRKMQEWAAQGRPASGDLESDLRIAVRAYLPSVQRQGAALRALIGSVGASPLVEDARRGVWGRVIDRWTTRYRREVDLPDHQLRALVELHVRGLWGLAGRWMAGELTAEEVEAIHIAVVTGSLAAVREPTLARSVTAAAPGSNSAQQLPEPRNDPRMP